MAANYVGPYSQDYYSRQQTYGMSPDPTLSASYQNYTPLNPATGTANSGQALGASTSATTSSDGGGGGSAPTSSGPDPFLQQIDGVFNPIMDFLGQAQSTLTSAQPGIEAQIGKEAEASLQSAGTEKARGERELKGAEEKAGQRKESAFGEARRLYNEMGIGGNQRFGRTSPIGEGFQALLGREFARNRGNIQQGYENTVQQIQGQMANLNESYQNAVTQINLQKDRFMAEARRRFDDKLLQIQQQRALAESEKADAKLGALQNLRNQIYQINLASATSQSQLDQQASTLQQELNTMISGVNQSVQSGQSLASAYSPDPQFSSTTIGGQPQEQGLQGIAINTKKDDDELFGNNGLFG